MEGSDITTNKRLLGFILFARLSLDEIGELLTLQDGAHCDEARELGEQKLTSVRRKISRLQQIERALNELVQKCSSGHGDVYCPLMASLNDGVEDATTDKHKVR